MSSSAAIPRFLLPQRGAIWRTRITSPSTLFRRHATSKSKKPSKPLVLAKPTKFTPPSHGTRLRRDAPRYPGPQLSEEELARQKTKKYPNMMPADGTFMHWFIHNRSIHLFICLGTLTTMALTVFVTNFKRDSPFADMIPDWTQLFLHPIAFTRTCIEILKLHTAHMTAETQERRMRKVEDVAKRNAYRKAHGLDTEAFGGWTAKTDAELQGPAIPLGDAAGDEGEHVQRRPPIKKWFGIW